MFAHFKRLEIAAVDGLAGALLDRSEFVDIWLLSRRPGKLVVAGGTAESSAAQCNADEVCSNAYLKQFVLPRYLGRE